MQQTGWMRLAGPRELRVRRGPHAAVALAAVIAMMLLIPAARSEPGPTKRFDGVWNTILSCTNSNGALGYSFEFPATVKDGVLHAEKGTTGQPGWLQLDGKILDDGAADLYANGIVGAAAFAVGQRPAGTQYGYHLAVTFSGTAGEGHRVEGRPCTVVFTRKP
jgi:hypothetical protein